MFFFFVGGVEQKSGQVLKTGVSQYLNCGSKADLVKYDKVLKVFFVRDCKWSGKKPRLHCNTCNMFFQNLSPKQHRHLCILILMFYVATLVPALLMLITNFSLSMVSLCNKFSLSSHFVALPDRGDPWWLVTFRGKRNWLRFVAVFNLTNRSGGLEMDKGGLVWCLGFCGWEERGK